MKYKGQTFQGQHLPLISRDLFDRCQAVRAMRSNHPRAFGEKKRVYVLAGVARCHECLLTLRCGATQSGDRWRYYRHTAQERGYDCAAPRKSIRADVQEKLRRVKQLYKDLLIDDQEYRTTVEQLQNRLAGLVLPDNPKVTEAAELLQDVRELWKAATLAEQRDLTRLMLKAAYVDLEQGQIVAIEPQPTFRMLLQAICDQLGVEIC